MQPLHYSSMLCNCLIHCYPDIITWVARAREEAGGG